MKRPAAFPVLVLALLLAPLPLFAEAMSCLDCHPDKREGTTVHAAIEMGCSSCHVGEHQGEKPAPKLSLDVPDLCYTCHDKTIFEKKKLHTPVAAGMCVSCHDPHATSRVKLLKAAVPELCFTCHDKKTMPRSEAHVSAAGGKCLTCHDPHGSDGAFILIQLMESHCQECHGEATPKHVMRRVSPGDSHPLKGRPDPLRPGNELACSSCHNPHTPDQERISVRDPKGPAALCLQCHKQIMVRP